MKNTTYKLLQALQYSLPVILVWVIVSLLLAPITEIGVIYLIATGLLIFLGYPILLVAMYSHIEQNYSDEMGFHEYNNKPHKFVIVANNVYVYKRVFGFNVKVLAFVTPTKYLIGDATPLTIFLEAYNEVKSHSTEFEL